MPQRIEAAKQATFETDDKRAQYARLAVFNHGVSEKIISKDADVNSVKPAEMQKAFKSLVSGTLLEGKDGITLIQKLTKANATDPKVAERGLTVAYAQEVRPFLKKGLLSPNFGRRGGLTDEERADRARVRAEQQERRMQERLQAAAERNKVDLSEIKGTGEGGAVTLADVNAAGKARRDAEKAEQKRLKEEEKARKAAEAEAAAAAAA